MTNIFTKRKQTFSIRKFTIGTASVLLSTMVVSSIGTETKVYATDKIENVSRDKEVKIKYNYIAEQELTKEEKKLIIENTPEKIAKENEVYYLVYKPTNKKTILPNTGNGVENIALISGISLLVLAIGISKNRRKILLSIITLTSTGQLAIGTEASALENNILAKYNKEVLAKMMDNLENPVIEIDGYKYIGYIKGIKNRENIVKEDSSINKPEITKSKEKIETKIPDEENIPTVTLPDENVETKIPDEENIPTVTLPDENIETKIPDEENIPTVTLPDENIETKIPDEKNLPTIDGKPEYKLTQTEIKEETEIPYTTETRENTNLEEGKKQVLQKGVVGKKVVTYKVTKGENGEILTKEEISTETTEAINEIIEIGTKKTLETKIPDEENIPTVTLPDENVETKIPDEENIPTVTLPDENVETKIPDEENIPTVTLPVENIETKIPDEENIPIVTLPVENIETKIPDEENLPTIEEKPEYKLTQTEVKEETEIPYTTETRENSNLEEGKKQVLQKGVAGKKVVTYKVTKGENGEILTKEEISTETTEAINEIIEIGTKKTLETKIPDEENIPTVTLPDEKIETKIPDEKNLPTIEEKPEYKLTQTEVKEETEIPYVTETRENSNLEEGKKQVLQKGVAGKKVVTYKVTKGENGEILTKEEISTETTEAINEIIEIGTKKPLETEIPDEENLPTIEEKPEYKLTKKEETEETALPYETEERENPELEKGKRNILQTGINGKKTIIFKVITGENGDILLKEQISVKEQPATNEIIEVGTKKVVNKDELNKAINSLKNLIIEAKGVDKTNKTELSITALENAIKLAQSTANNGNSVIKDTDINQNEVDSMTKLVLAKIEELTQAKNSLVDKTNKTKLKEQLEIAGTKNEDDYTEDSWAKLQEALKTANPIYNNDNSKQPEIDSETTKLQQVLNSLEKKQVIEPIITSISVKKNDLEKMFTVDYTLTDEGKNYSSSTLNVYDNNNLIQTIPINFENEKAKVIVKDLDYKKDYRLETTLNYTNKQNTITKNVESNITGDVERENIVRLELKKIELRNITSAILYGLENNEYKKYEKLNSIPSNVKNYFVKVQSDIYKDVYIPIEKIEEIEKDGKQIFKVTAKSSDLVQSTNNIYEEKYEFYVDKVVETKDNVYYSFSELVTAINSNLSGEFILGDNLNADEVTLSSGTESYVNGQFTGKLIGEKDGKAYAIFNLQKPLFNEIKNSEIKHLDLKKVAIIGNENIGSLAKTAITSTIEDVAVEGSIVANRNVGGLVFEAKTNTTIKNVIFKGKIDSESNTGGGSNVGGIVGILHENSRLEKALVSADIKVSHPQPKTYKIDSYRVGGIAGSVTGQPPKESHIKDVYVEGTVSNSSTGGFTSGLVATTYFVGNINNAVSAMKVTNGFKIYADNGTLNDGYFVNRLKNISVITNEATGNKENYKLKYGEISREEANKKIAAMNITATLDNTEDELFSAKSNKRTTDYTNVTDYKTSHTTAYKNLEKLLPFYNKELIVEYGNKVEINSNLFTKEILSVTAMKDNEFVNDLTDTINKIAIHYKDGTIEYKNISNKKIVLNNQIAEYTLTGTELIYTPNQIINNNYANEITTLKDIINNLELYSDEVITFFGLDNKKYTMDNNTRKERETALEKKNGHKPTAEEKKADEIAYAKEQKIAEIKRLYWEETNNILKNNMETHLSAVLKNSANILHSNNDNIIKGYLKQYIENHKLEFLLGSLYMERHYNVKFGDFNIKNIMMYNPDFYGKEFNTLDRLIKIGGLGYSSLLTRNNTHNYKEVLANYTTKDNLISWLDYNRQLFTSMDKYTWFNDATKDNLIVVEKMSKEVPEAEYKAYDRLLKDSFTSYILPLLNLKDSQLFIVSNMSTITFGSNSRRNWQLEKYKQAVELLANRQANHIDMWYKLANDDVKNRLVRDVALPTWDGYVVPGTWNWFGEFGENNSNKNSHLEDKGLREFFGPINKYYKNNNLGAYADGSLVHFVINDILDDEGASVWTHEMTHNYDGSIYLGGYGRRDGIGAEEFALGMLHSIFKPNQEIIGINTMIDFNDNNRLHNKTLDRFKIREDLKEYVHGMHDVLYMLDYSEANSVISKGKEALKSWYNVIENIADGKNAVEKIRSFTDDEWNKLNITSVDDMIDNNFITKRYYKVINKTDRNGYWTTHMFSPIYATGENITGAPGGIIFKRMTFEMLAEFGYENGFLGYTSNKYKTEAKSAGVDLNDRFIIAKASNSKYTTMNNFKKSMFKERINKLSKLKPITVNGITISNYTDLERLMTESVEKDIKNNTGIASDKSEVVKLKKEIYHQYLLLTDDFRTSIFND